MAIFRKPYGADADNPLGQKWRRIMSNLREAAKDIQQFKKELDSYADTVSGAADTATIATEMGMDETQIAEWMTMVTRANGELAGTVLIDVDQGGKTWLRVLLDQQG